MSEILSGSEEAISIPTWQEFYDVWGEESGFGKRQFRKYWESAEAEYSDLPYHNFGHAVEALWTAMDLADACEANYVPVDRKVLIGAALFHDAGFHEIEPNGMSKEAHSVDIFLSHDAERHYSQDQIYMVVQAIMATSTEFKPETIEDRILVRADIDNIGQDYETFSASTARLRQECRQMQGDDFSERQFIANSLKILRSYVGNDLSLGEFDTDNWTIHALQNIGRLGGTAVGKLLKRGENGHGNLNS